MATSITLTLRCQSKMLVTGTGNEVFVTVGLQSAPAGMPGGSSLSTMVATVDDTFVMGNLYNVAITDASA